MMVSGRRFYLPHGITADADNNYWLTDVALHQVRLCCRCRRRARLLPPPLTAGPVVPPQVLKVSSDGRDRVLVALGEAFVPGSDRGHFCKPTDVAVDPQTGSVFVSDGYCNARILKFSSEGKYLTEWGAGSGPTPFPPLS